MPDARVPVTWTLYLDPEGTAPVSAPHTSLLPRWAQRPQTAVEVAALLTEQALEQAAVWEPWCGLETAQATVYLHITAPETCAGWYVVTARRPVQAEARRMHPPPQAGQEEPP